MNQFQKVSYEQFIKDLAPRPDDEMWVKEAWDNIQLPRRQTVHSAGYDFYLPLPVSIPPYGQRVCLTGVKCHLDDDCVLLLDIRSSAGIKRGLTLANTIGVIDADYYGNPDNEGHIQICIRNNTDEWVYLDSGERIAQGIIVGYLTTFDDTADGERSGGIGSTK